MELAVSTDMLVGGRHFFADADAYGVGWKALAVNLSDLAAMGARARWVTLSLALPEPDEGWIGAFMRGFLELADAFDVDLIGGDTTRGPLNICVQIFGEVPPGQALVRSGAQPGDEVWVSGTVGDAALALAHLRGEIELRTQESDYVRARLDRPTPRIGLGNALRGLASSAIDVSDGLVADAGHLAERSRARLVIDWPWVPLSPPAQGCREQALVQRCALAGGDDYELCFTAAASRHGELLDLAARLELALTPIGRVEAGAGVVVLDATGRALALPEQG